MFTLHIEKDVKVLRKELANQTELINESTQLLFHMHVYRDNFFSLNLDSFASEIITWVELSHLIKWNYFLDACA